MCGICGFIGFEDRKILQNMIASLSHRGPDGNGSFSDGIVSLGHTRLSIIDLSVQGNQPMQNEEGTIWLTYNGETYNYQELRESLLKHHIFRSHTDTETLIHAYEEYGLDFIHKIRAMFAFALYDSSQKKLYLARDHIGKKPLYYYFDGSIFIFGSEIKAILQAGVPRVINSQGLASFLSYEYTIGAQTIFEGIYKVPAGHILSFDIQNFSFNLTQYWNITENITQKPLEYYVSTLRRYLDESATLRTIADVPVGAFLSGGLDSSAVVGLVRPKVDYSFHTFSMGFDGFDSELPYAHIVADLFDTCHHEIYLEPKAAITAMDTITWHYDEPISDSAVIANYFLAKEARKHVKVVVAGEGGDEVFAGYNVYKSKMLMRRLHIIPPHIRVILNQIRESIIHSVPSWERSDINSVLYRWLKENYYESIISNHRVMNNEELGSLSDNNLILNEKMIPMPNSHHPLNKLLEFDCRTILAEKYLMKADTGI